METERRISTGIDGLDEAIDYLRPGDTVVWQCEHISDYMYVATRFVTNVARKGDRIVYIRFADHEEIMDTAALRERDDTGLVFDAIDDPNTVTVAQVAPAVRAAWAEQFGLDSEFATPKRMVAALRELGFNYVFDTDFAADLTIMEEGSEFIERFTHKDQYPWPMFTSCCPGWVRFVKSQYPELTDNLSTAKSPQQMFGAIAKTYYPEKAGIDPAKIVSVSVMPCTAKKAEAARPEMCDSGYRDVDIVITTRELGRMIREAGIDFKNLPEENFDSPLGTGSGAGVIFGTTGGVMEAALRTVADVLAGENLPHVDYEEVRGMEHTREAELEIAGKKIKIAVVHTLKSAMEMLERVKNGTAGYQFIEVMACPGGCIGGGGQPVPVNAEIRKLRRKGLFDCDRANELRKSHENPEIIELYDTWLGKPLGEKAHNLLHTHYHQQIR